MKFSAELDASGQYDIAVEPKFKGTLTLSSVDANRKIELSVDGGKNYFIPTYDTEEPGNIAVVINAPISNIRFIGSQGDSFGILR